MGRLLSVNVGLPRDIAWQGRTVHTAIWKTPVDRPRMVRRLNIDGDGQGDLAGHGGEHRAVFVYQEASYRYWQAEMGRNDFVYGQFGENFTVDGLADADVCIGDRYQIGGALFEVTQPRVTCFRLGIRMKEPEMAALLVRHGRPGFYFRVIEEGLVAPGDDIVQVAYGPERMSVSEINGLLYLPGHSRAQLQRALLIPALSAGWKGAFEALFVQDKGGVATTGNVGLTASSSPPPAWRGFRSFRVSAKTRENEDVTSLVLEPSDGQPLATALPGQFIVLKLQPASGPALMRSYSLAGQPDAGYYRLGIKRRGLVSLYVHQTLKVGDTVLASAARGNFTLKPGDTPVVLVGAGIGVTPVLAMLHALAGTASTREIWWLYATHNGHEHPFAEETRKLLKTLVHSRSHVFYSAPDAKDRLHVDYDAAGHIDTNVLHQLDLPHDADFYLCGPSSFMSDLTAGLATLGVPPDRIHTEAFGAGPSFTPGIAASKHRTPHVPDGLAGSGPLVSFARSGLDVKWGPAFHNLLELAEACDVPVRWSCRTGVCHSCETALVAGAVSNRPEPIDAPAEGNVLICCARPEGDIVLDL